MLPFFIFNYVYFIEIRELSLGFNILSSFYWSLNFNRLSFVLFNILDTIDLSRIFDSSVWAWLFSAAKSKSYVFAETAPASPPANFIDCLRRTSCKKPKGLGYGNLNFTSISRYSPNLFLASSASFYVFSVILYS